MRWGVVVEVEQLQEACIYIACWSLFIIRFGFHNGSPANCMHWKVQVHTSFFSIVQTCSSSLLINIFYFHHQSQQCCSGKKKLLSFCAQRKLFISPPLEVCSAHLTFHIATCLVTTVYLVHVNSFQRALVIRIAPGPCNHREGEESLLSFVCDFLEATDHLIVPRTSIHLILAFLGDLEKLNLELSIHQYY